MKGDRYKMFKVKPRKKKKRKLNLDTFTKVWVNRIMYLSWICIFWCFVLATIGRENIAEELATCIVINIVGVFIGYLTKSFFETREEKRMLSKTNDAPENNVPETENSSSDEDEMLDA